VDTVIFDKTGTLTNGIFKVTSIISKSGFTEEEVLQYGAYAEYHSTHPIAVSIRNRYLEDESKQGSTRNRSPAYGTSRFGSKYRWRKKYSGGNLA